MINNKGPKIEPCGASVDKVTSHCHPKQKKYKKELHIQVLITLST